VFVKKSGGGLELSPIEAEVLRNWQYAYKWKIGPGLKRIPKALRDLSDHYPVKVKFQVTRISPPK
jgi:hypothetical protein